MISKGTLAILAAVAALGGCATIETHRLSTFDEPAAVALLKPGKNQIRGSALLRQVGGGVINCAGLEVRLIPFTLHAAERVTAIYGPVTSGFIRAGAERNIKFQNESADYFRHVRRTSCDAQGFFKFDNVADGTFYVGTTITWQTNPYVHEGGSLIQRTVVTGGETKELVLTLR